MNEQRFVVSDVLWQRLEPYLLGKLSDAGATAKGNRLFPEAVFWRVRIGSPWRDLPPSFGHWNTQFRRFRRWAQAGVFESLFNAMREDIDLEYPRRARAAAQRVHSRQLSRPARDDRILGGP
ncbi:transposase [uncultured Roseobacter sp.]|uniref:transposase n=1 Tax=uncultured Roseobacter sp. TaxID=114847 RepID=UPI00261E1593|nr:transposase [uncultured Roseobacter sp.]